MNSRYKAYPEYKDSSSKWFGNIPIDWSIAQLRRSLLDHKQGYYTTDDYVDDGIKLLRITDLRADGGIDFSQCPKVPRTDPTLINYKLKTGDVVFARTGGAGSFGVVNNIIEEVVFASYLIRFRFCTESFVASYLKYVLRADSFQKAVKENIHGGVNQNIHAEDIKGTYLAEPPREQQIKIANFLDHETARIDTLIAKQEKLIELLKEKRQAVISHAVTKGLNPDVPMKDSGVEWLGEVPEHWGVTKLGMHASKIGSGKTPRGGADVYQESGVLFLRSQNVYDDGLRISGSEATYISDDIHLEMRNTQVKAGDVLLNITGGSIGRSCIVPANIGEANVNQHVCILRFNKNIAEYISFVMKSSATKEQIDVVQVGGNREGLNFEQIADMKFCLPSIDEIKEINSFILNYLDKYQSLNVKALKTIELMQERKTALISAAVTGKIDVRDFVAK